MYLIGKKRNLWVAFLSIYVILPNIQNQSTI